MEAVSLYELTAGIRQAIADMQISTWVIAEISEINSNRSGHVYIDLIEKSSISGNVIAKLRATIWCSCAQRILPKFEVETGQSLRSGMKGMFFVTVGFHEVYGLSANISAINSEFTLGDIERQRRETIMRLEQEGVIDMNKSLQLPTVLKHIAIISAETAAGYGDFCKQIENNVYDFNLSLKLYPAQMQGIGADNSIMEALDRIINEPKHPDAVVIIRGGGSRSDLACFDSYELAFYVANYPLPILTGIGHERDNSVVDIVAHTRLKTPTAVAEFIIGHNVEFLNLLDTLSEKIITLARSFYELRNTKVEALFLSLRTSVNSIMHSYSERLTQMTNTIALTSNNVVSQRLMQLDSIEQIIKAHDPRDLLKKGYSLTMINGKTLRSAKEVNAGDKIQTLLSDGVVSSIVE